MGIPSTRSAQPRPQPDGTTQYAWNYTDKNKTDPVVLTVQVRNTLPIVFVPGVMGTNLRAKDKEKTQVWRLDSMGGLFLDKLGQNAGARQKFLHPDRTEVDSRGATPPKTRLAGSLTNASQAIERWWGEIGTNSYHDFMLMLERTLNGHQLRDPASVVKNQIEALWALRSDGDPDWHPHKPLIPSAPSDFTNLEDWYFPVYACGYNWLEDNAKSASDTLKPRIDDIIKKNNHASARCEQVIVVTHSMGGLVALACQQLPGMEAKIAGIVHGVMPVDGAPLAYRRCKLGLGDEKFGLGTVIGKTGQEVTAVFAQAPGPLELLPTHRYKAGWLELRGPDNKVVQKQMHTGDPYSEIYKRKDRWWALIKEEWLAPDRLTGIPIRWDDYLKFIDRAEFFHKQTLTPATYHPNTYAFYGADNKGDTRSFEGIVWQMKVASSATTGQGLTPDEVYEMSAQQVLMEGVNPEKVPTKKKTIPVGGSENGDDHIQWELRIEFNPKGTGDGTVPAQSGAVPAKNDKVRQVFRVVGVEHEPAYSKSTTARQVTLYAISKIALEARKPQDQAAVKP